MFSNRLLGRNQCTSHCEPIGSVLCTHGSTYFTPHPSHREAYSVTCHLCQVTTTTPCLGDCIRRQCIDPYILTPIYTISPISAIPPITPTLTLALTLTLPPVPWQPLIISSSSSSYSLRHLLRRHRLLNLLMLLIIIRGHAPLA